ncbi:MAG: hypothetical protein ACEY3D_03215 [Rickettsia sp.]
MLLRFLAHILILNLSCERSLLNYRKGQKNYSCLLLDVLMI